MPDPDPTADILSFRELPEVAAALRDRRQTIVRRWNDAVKKHLPDADPLTAAQVRDSIPLVLEKIAQALESADVGADLVTDVGRAHGVSRAQQNYKIEELLTEYRILRAIVFEELLAARGTPLGYAEILAVNVAIDAALASGVSAFAEHRRTQLQSAAESESKFLSFLSHDVRNNLNAVTLMLDVLARRLSQREEFREDAEDLRALQRSILETTEGMDRLLDSERLRRGAVVLKLAPVRLRDLVEALLSSSFLRRAQAKGLTVENAMPAAAAAQSDRELLTLVLQNLIGNAIKFSARGTVRVAAESVPDGWRLSVSDQGPGISPERLRTLFHAFTRGETHGQSGLGLGLSIASHAAHLLGNELQVQSTLGRGSTFSLIVPAAKPEDAA